MQCGPDESYVRRILGYAFLAPDIVESILDERQPHDLTFEKLRGKLPMSWAEQRSTILRSESAVHQTDFSRLREFSVPASKVPDSSLIFPR